MIRFGSPRRVRRARAAGALALLACAIASAPSLAYEHRQSTPSFGMQGGFGKLYGSQVFHAANWPGGATDFKIADVTQWGPSIDIGVRFVLDRSHALGFGFDDLRYRRKGGYTQGQSDALPNWVKFTTFHADYYLYFQRRSKASYYLAPFIGFQQQEMRWKHSGQPQAAVPEVAPGEYRFLYGGTLGTEYFIGRSFSFDGGVRMFMLSQKGGMSVAFQPALGFQVYVIS